METTVTQPSKLEGRSAGSLTALVAELPGGGDTIAILVRLQYRVLAGGAEVPEVVDARGLVFVQINVVQVQVPVDIYAGIVHGGLQLVSGVALNLLIEGAISQSGSQAGSVGVKIAVDDTRAGDSDKSTGVPL